jgi:hypothetical protein
MSRFFRGGPAGFQKPENALKRADELIAVGQSGAALQVSVVADRLGQQERRAQRPPVGGFVPWAGGRWARPWRPSA